MRRVAVLLGVAVLAGCGGSPHSAAPQQPHLSSALAGPWRAQADAVAAALAAGDGCLARERATALQASVIDAVNRRALPPRFQEPLVSAVNDLAARISCVPPAPPPPTHEHKKHEKHGKHKK